IESSFAAMALSGGDAVLARIDGITENYLVRYEELARKEIALAGMTGRDRVLFIGSGPLPITAIEYHRQTGCEVDCVDFSPQAIDTSHEVLGRLRLDSAIHPQLLRGENVPAGGWTVVLVGVLARPKREIFENLARVCPDGCRVLARTTFGLRGLIYEPMGWDPASLGGFRMTGTNEARADQIISAIGYVLGR
ncbi:MAG: nicotianamine synthase family protein, partial [Candidatus Eisenbacteria bacterium]|nr:nicotianamine synthase family protein [Candidatus Eisenbacteria bacterium]